MRSGVSKGRYGLYRRIRHATGMAAESAPSALADIDYVNCAGFKSIQVAVFFTSGTPGTDTITVTPYVWCEDAVGGTGAWAKLQASETLHTKECSTVMLVGQAEKLAFAITARSASNVTLAEICVTGVEGDVG